MSGSGNFGGDSPSQQPGYSLGGKIQAEISSALRLLFKSVGQQAVDISITPPLTLYVTQMTCENYSVGLEQPPIQISEDPIQALSQPAQSVNFLPLIENVSLAADAPCHIQPVLCLESAIEPTDAVITGIAFENVRFTSSHQATLEPMTTEIWHKDVDGFTRPAVRPLNVGKFKANSQSMSDQAPQAKVREHPRLFCLPIRKMPIPPHRFSQAVRDIFRAALAEKADTKASNVQLKVVFERMNVAFYTSIQQDEQGHLLCVPKNELIGKNAQSKTGQALLDRLDQNTENAYLVVGFRLDNKQDIRAMVPVNQCL
ncbi:hypothetical protein [Vampirovibrio sp.]|uniref:hypothetical protein n=1 Tax=Vampirovibrio sp. TaxID=2717857 RepID=UPI003592F75D